VAKHEWAGREGAWVNRLYYSDFKEALKTDLKKDPDKGYYIAKGRFKNDHQAIIPLWGITTEEAYRFLCSKWVEKKMAVKKKQSAHHGRV